MTTVSKSTGRQSLTPMQRRGLMLRNIGSRPGSNFCTALGSPKWQAKNLIDFMDQHPDMSESVSFLIMRRGGQLYSQMNSIGRQTWIELCINIFKGVNRYLGQAPDEAELPVVAKACHKLFQNLNLTYQELQEMLTEIPTLEQRSTYNPDQYFFPRVFGRPISPSDFSKLLRTYDQFCQQRVAPLLREIHEFRQERDKPSKTWEESIADPRLMSLTEEMKEIHGSNITAIVSAGFTRYLNLSYVQLKGSEEDVLRLCFNLEYERASSFVHRYYVNLLDPSKVKELISKAVRNFERFLPEQARMKLSREMSSGQEPSQEMQDAISVLARDLIVIQLFKNWKHAGWSLPPTLNKDEE